jgi:hypothetical protein
MAKALLVCTKAQRKNRYLWYLFYGQKVCKVMKYTFLCSVWRQCSLLEKCIQVDRYVQKKPDKYD